VTEKALETMDVSPADVRQLAGPGYESEVVGAVIEQLATSRPDPDAMLKTATSTLSKLRPGTWVAARFSRDARTARVVARSDADPEMAQYVLEMPVSDRLANAPIYSSVIETGEPILVPKMPYEEFLASVSSDIRDFLATRPPPAPILDLGVLAVAMRVRGTIVGTLGVFKRPDSWVLTTSDIQWVQRIADYTGLAIEYALLHVDAINRRERLTALRSVGMAISGSPDRRLTLQVILDQAVAGLRVDAADILLLDESDGLLAFVAGTGFQSTSIPDYRLPVTEALTGQALARRRIESTNVQGTLTHFRRRSLFAREGFKAFWALPLVARGKVVGVLEVFHRSHLQPDDEWLDFLDALGTEAAIAIDHVAMFGRLQESGSQGTRKPRAASPQLSRLDQEIIGFIAEGLTNRAIAEKVHLSPHTIKFHVRQIFKKMGVANRTELASKAAQEGWLYPIPERLTKSTPTGG
jgi:DNA-binding CsgD family transcriptional regulator